MMTTTKTKTYCGQLACLAAALTALAVLASCQTRPLDYVVKDVSSGIPILVSGPGMGPETKTAKLDSTTFKDFGIYAGWARNGHFDENTPANDYMNGAMVKKDSITGVWGTEVKYYWPARNNGTISFFAFAPHIADSTVLRFAPGYKGGSPVLRYTPSQTAQKQMDLCLAGALYDKTVADNPLSFHFAHTLTNIQFWAKYEKRDSSQKKTTLPDGMHLKIDRLALTNIIGTKDIRWTDGSPGFAWSGDTEENRVDYTLQRTSGELTDTQLDTAYRQLEYANAILLLLPQTINDTTRSVKSKLEIDFSIFRTAGGTTTRLSTFNLEAELPENRRWEPANVVRYQFTVNVDGLSIVDMRASSGGWIENWKASGNTDPNQTIEK